MEWLSITWTIILGTGMLVGPATQSNAIAQSISGTFSIDPLYVGITICVLEMLVLIGGLKSISNFANAVVPFMAIAYIIASLYVIGINIDAVPHAFAMISMMHLQGLQLQVVSSVRLLCCASAGGSLAGFFQRSRYRYSAARS